MNFFYFLINIRNQNLIVSYYFLYELIFSLENMRKNSFKELDSLKTEKNYFEKEKSVEFIATLNNKLGLFIVNFFVKLILFYEKQNRMVMIDKLHMYQNYYVSSQPLIISSLTNIEKIFGGIDIF